MFYIPRVLPKPGMALSTNENYAALLLCTKNLASKTPTINLTIQQKKGEMDKENVAVIPNADVGGVLYSPPHIPAGILRNPGNPLPKFMNF